MIDWSSVDLNSADAWNRLAENLLTKGQNAILAESLVDMQALQKDFLEFAQKATLACPQPTQAAINRGQTQLAQAAIAHGISNMKERSAKFDAFAARMSSAVNELRVATSLLRLEPVRKALDLASVAATNLKTIRAQLAQLPQDDVEAQLDVVLNGVNEVMKKLSTALG